MTAQDELVRRMTDVFGSDDRFRGLWLTGSFGTGTADEFSDVDTVLLVRPDAVEAVLADWPRTADDIAVVILLRRLGDAPVFSHVLDGWLRWDVVVATHETARLVRGMVREVFDKDGITLADPEPTGLDLGAVSATAEEFLRCLGLLPVVAGRGDGVSAQLGAALLRQQLVALLRMRAEAGRPEGALHLRRTLPIPDYATLAGLPAPGADVGEAVQAHRALADVFLPVARELMADVYPDPLERACLAHLEAQLGAGWGRTGRHGRTLGR